MKVFSNTTPFIALSSIGRLDLLPTLFQSIYVCESVMEECRQGGGIRVPELSSLTWINRVVAPQTPTIPLLIELDRGERDTLAACVQQQADLLIIDEKIGRNVGEYLGLKITGTLGVLLRARKDGLIPSFTDAVIEMQRQGIRYSRSLIERLRSQIGES